MVMSCLVLVGMGVIMVVGAEKEDFREMEGPFLATKRFIKLHGTDQDKKDFKLFEEKVSERQSFGHQITIHHHHHHHHSSPSSSFCR